MANKGFTVLLVIVLALNLLPGQTRGAEKVRVASSVRLNPLYNLPWAAADEKGIWREKGLDATWIALTAGAALNQALAAASVDIGMSSTATVIQGTARGVPQIIVADGGAIDTYVFWVPSNSPITRPQELKGKKIATARFGAVTHTYGQVVFKNLGIEKDVKWVSTGGTAQTMAAMKTGAIDVAIWARFTGIGLKVKGEVKELLVVHDYLPKPWSDVGLSGHKEFIKRQPTTVRRTLETFFLGADFLMKNKSWALEKLKSQYGFSPAAAELIYPELRYGKDGRIDKKAIENIVRFLVEYGIVAKERMPPVEELYTAEFAG